LKNINVFCRSDPQFPQFMILHLPSSWRQAVPTVTSSIEDLRVDVKERHGQPVLAVNSSVTFMTASAVRDEVERHLRDGQVRVLDLRGSHFIDATGAMALAQVLGAHPGVEAWVMRERGHRKLLHAGIPQERIRLLGNQAVSMPEVFRAIEASAA
ncbi:MAG TPA: STAS domain-containing protein, partial [Burkholderiales bacterium]